MFEAFCSVQLSPWRPRPLVGTGRDREHVISLTRATAVPSGATLVVLAAETVG